MITALFAHIAYTYMYMSTRKIRLSFGPEYCCHCPHGMRSGVSATFQCPSVCPSLCLSVSLSVRLSVCLSVCLSLCLSVCLSVRLSVCPSVCLSVYLSVRPSVCPVDGLQQRRAAGLLLSACVCSRRPSCGCGQRHVVSRGARFDTEIVCITELYIL